MKNRMDTVGSSFVPNYLFTFNFEDEYVHDHARNWMINNWTIGFYFCGLYLILIFAGQSYMKNRPAYELRGGLSLWNTTLALFSIVGLCRTAPELFHVVRNYGIYHSVCVASNIEEDNVAGFWSWIFALSKLPEFGDTAFIVLRKQPLIFLHWYHHITVLMYCWFSFTEATSHGRWFVVMNYFVHSIMYTYFALKAMGYRPPRSIAMTITLCQLIQMIIGCAINLRALQILRENKRACNVSMLNIKLSFGMYFSYLVLFARFFYKNYFSGNRKKLYVNGKSNGVSELPLVNGVNGKLKSH